MRALVTHMFRQLRREGSRISTAKAGIDETGSSIGVHTTFSRQCVVFKLWTQFSRMRYNWSTPCELPKQWFDTNPGPKIPEITSTRACVTRSQNYPPRRGI